VTSNETIVGFALHDAVGKLALSLDAYIPFVVRAYYLQRLSTGI
jgi:hypothetical protein